MTKIAIIIGSTRPNRVGESVGRWVQQQANQRDDAAFELIDLREINLPLLDEPVPPAMGQYSKEHTKAWAAKVASFDAFVFVTAEYNHSVPASLKNALDFVYAEWNNKAAACVSYGSAGGARAVEQLRLILSELQIAHVRNQVMFSLFEDFENFSDFKPRDRHKESLTEMLDQLISWAGGFKKLREATTKD